MLLSITYTHPPNQTHHLSLCLPLFLTPSFLSFHKPSPSPSPSPSFKPLKSIPTSLLCILNMIAGLDFLGSGGTGGGGGGSGSGSGSGGGGSSLSTVSRAEVVEQDYIGLSSEVSSSTLNTELNLGLSLGGGGKCKTSCWGEYGRILTAQDFPSIGSSSSSSSSGKTDVTSPLMPKTAVSGTKRGAESIAQEGGSANGAVSNQVVGWPPLRSSRINILVNHTKNPSVEDDKMIVETNKSEDIMRKKADDRNNNGSVPKKCHIGHLLFVKVNMDGVPIGRKVDLSAHNCYGTLAKALEDMFFYNPISTNTANFIGSNEEQENGAEAKKASKLLGGSSEFVLTYEDKDGDWMLVGDVPWGMFLNTAKRLRIMRTSEANGLAPRFHSTGDRQRKKPI